MKSYPDDLKTYLLSNINNASGIYNGLGWKIININNAQEDELKYVSYHEAAHSYLNNRTAFGCILLGYAGLHSLNIENDNQYLEIMKQLISRCEIAHEVYATWNSVSLFKKNQDDHSCLTRFSISQPYLTYYHMALKFVHTIPSCYLQNICVEAIISWCFQSTEIGNAACIDFDSSWISKVRNHEFPDFRLKYLSNNFSSDFLKCLVKEFISNNKFRSGYEFMLAEFNDDHTAPLPSESNELDIIAYDFYDFLSSRLDIIYNKSSTLKSDEHLPVATIFFNKIYEKYPRDKYNHLVLLNTKPHDVDWTKLGQSETEEIFITQKPLPTIVYTPNLIPDEYKLILVKAAENGELIVHCRHTATLALQYTFNNNVDKDFFTNNYGALVFIRFQIYSSDEKNIIIIPFFDSDSLSRFLTSLTENAENNNTFPCISIGVYADEAYHDKWGALFMGDDQITYILNDTSIRFCLKFVFKDKGKITYEEVSIHLEDKHYQSIVFYLTVDTNIWIVITPVSPFLLDEVKHYIKYYYTDYLYEAKLSDNQKISVQHILNSIFSEEHSWYLRTQFAIEKLLEE